MAKHSTKSIYRGLRVLTISEDLANDPTIRNMAAAGLDMEHTAVLLHPCWKTGNAGRFLLAGDRQLFWLDGAFERSMGIAEREGYHFTKTISEGQQDLLVRLNADGTADVDRRLYPQENRHE